ncbi:MAG: capsule assembly Wzi family protein [Spirochaetaceae bacterium]|jgi:hypothetical protein|nr:capsule assembly Wzi family protein [Spirochaetaceae bacterium]
MFRNREYRTFEKGVHYWLVMVVMNMKMRVCIAVCFFFAGLFAGAGDSSLPYTVFSPGDPIFEKLRFLVVESGNSFLSFTPPLSRNEILNILNDINEESLTPSSRELYWFINDALKPKTVYSEGVFSLSAHILAQPEVHMRTNPDIEFTEKYSARRTALSFPLNFYFSDRAQVAITPMFSSDPSYYAQDGSYAGTNIPYSDSHFDMNMPLRAFIAAGGSWWSLQFGRDKISYGLGRSGNLALSDNPDYYDFLRLSVFISDIKYSLLVTQLPLDLGWDNGNYSLIAETKRDIIDPQKDLLNTTQRYFYLHRLDLRLFKKISVGLSEGIMVGNSAPEIRFLNPFTLFHSFFAWRDYADWGKDGKGSGIGSLFSLDINWAIVPALSLYGQFVMNQFAWVTEADDPTPNALGYLLGMEYTRYSFDVWRTVFYGEFVYTDPYLYTLSSPFASYISMRRLSPGPKRHLRYMWTGHEEGRDMMLFTLGAAFSKAALSFAFDLSYIARGEHNSLKWDWTDAPGANTLQTPSGNVEHQISLGVRSTWKPLEWLGFSGYIGGVASLNNEHRDGNNQYGAELGLSVSVMY